jgi:hypothetical protein
MSSETRFIDVIIGVAVAALGAFLFVASDQYSELGAAFPKAVGAAMMVLALILVAGSALRRRARTVWARLHGSLLRRLAFVAVMAVWGIALPWLGIVLASAIGIAGLTVVSNFAAWDARRVMVHVAGHVAIFSFFYFLLAYGLQVPLPQGRLF